MIVSNITGIYEFLLVKNTTLDNQCTEVIIAHNHRINCKRRSAELLTLVIILYIPIYSLSQCQ